MIHVPLPPEPDSFDARVRQEGLAHFREQGQDPAQPPPGRALFAMKRTMANGGERSCEYWQLAKDDLCEAYRNRCVYHKGNAVIPEDHDPTCLQGDALVLAENHDGLLIVVPNPKLSAAEQARLADTVAKLGLNQSAVALARKDCYDDFIVHVEIYGRDFMRERQPFVYEFIAAVS